MYILAIESSGNVASAAVAEDSKILAEYTVNIGKTHSQTLLPMIDRVLADAEVSVNEMDAIAVSRGPGSFTGLRIGSATAKGLAAAAGIPIVEVPTLEALAIGVASGTCGAGAQSPIPAPNGGRLICPVIDARRNEVYTALFEEAATFDNGSGLGVQDDRTHTENCEGNEESTGQTVYSKKIATVTQSGLLRRIGEERAMSMEDLLEELAESDKEVIFTGDALRIHAEKIKASGNGRFILAPLSAWDLRAGCVATVGLNMLGSGKAIEGSKHSPVYLRLSSAERERLEQGKSLEN